MQKVNISKIRENKHNPRTIKGEMLAKLKKSITDFPEMLKLRPIVIDDKGIILGGNMRYHACKELGIEEVYVLSADSLTDAQKKEFIIKDNIGFGDWDFDELANSWDAELLQDWGLDVGFDVQCGDEELATLADAEPEESTETTPTTKLGDLWRLGEHMLLCADSTNADNHDVVLDGMTVDMVCTDPPYGMAYKSGRGTFDSIKGDKEDPTKFYHAIPAAREAYVWGKIPNYANLKSKPKATIVWDKGHFGLGAGYRPQYELCFYYGEFKGNDSDVWACKRDSNCEHPTQKPVELCLRAIDNSKPSNVFDLYAGSGSTMLACEHRGIPFRGIELDPVYCDVAIRRWEEQTSKKAELVRNILSDSKQ
jgi:DNA modification methylase